MSRAALVGLLAALLLPACGSVHQDFVARVDARTRLLLPQYKEYVRNDPTLTPTSKSERLQLADDLQRLVNDAREE